MWGEDIPYDILDGVLDILYDIQYAGKDILYDILYGVLDILYDILYGGKDIIHDILYGVLGILYDQTATFCSCDDKIAVKVFSRPTCASSSEMENFRFHANCLQVSLRHVWVRKLTLRMFLRHLFFFSFGLRGSEVPSCQDQAQRLRPSAKRIRTCPCYTYIYIYYIISNSSIPTP